MLKRLFLLGCCAVGLTVCAAAEKVYISVNVRGDDAATIEVLEKSAGVTPKAKSTGLANKKPGRAQGFSIPLNENGEAEMTLKLKLTGKGEFDIAGFGLSAKRGTMLWVDCVNFVLDGETLIPQGDVTAVPFAKFRRLSGAKGIPIDGTRELTIKAAFRKVDAARAEKLNAQFKKTKAGAKKQSAK